MDLLFDVACLYSTGLIQPMCNGLHLFSFVTALDAVSMTLVGVFFHCSV